MDNKNLITQAALNDLLARGAIGLSILDASWYLPAQGRDGRAEFESSRIPCAQYFDVDAISDQSSHLPHMMPTADQFAESVGKLGVSDSDHIIVYDGLGIFSCARAWWMFKAMGAQNVQILAGGFDQWKAAGLPIETGDVAITEPATFNASYNASKVRHLDDMRDNVKSQEALVLDARPAGRFSGEVPEPRKGLRSGHMPGSASLPIDRLLDKGTLRSREELRKIFTSVGVDQETPVITTCGSGVTAAIISLTLDTIGHDNHTLYDGSWAEWGQAEDAPVIGKAE